MIGIELGNMILLDMLNLTLIIWFLDKKADFSLVLQGVESGVLDFEVLMTRISLEAHLKRLKSLETHVNDLNFALQENRPSNNMENEVKAEPDVSESVAVEQMGGEAVYMFSVYLHEGFDLIAGDIDGGSDPFIRITVGDVSRDSAIIPHDRNPKWNQGMGDFFIVDPESTEIFFSALDWDRVGRPDPLGTATIDPVNYIKMHKEGKAESSYLPLKGVMSGSIQVTIRYKRFVRSPQ